MKKNVKPKVCTDCEAAKANSSYLLHSAKCAHCGARLIVHILHCKANAEERAERARAVIADWVKFGNDEKRIRELVRKREIYAPRHESLTVK